MSVHLSPRLAHLRAAADAAKTAEPDDAPSAPACQWCAWIEAGNSDIPRLGADDPAGAGNLRKDIQLRGMEIFAARRER